MRLLLLKRVCGFLVLLSSIGRSDSLPIESVPYKGAVDYAGYPATNPANVYPPPPPPGPIVLPFGFQPIGNPIPSTQPPPNMSPGSVSDASTMVGAASPGGRPIPQRQQTLYEAKNRPPTPFERPTPKRQQTVPAGHWHPSMGMSPSPPSPTAPFIPPGFSDPKSSPKPAKSSDEKSKKKTSGYEGDDEMGRLRKTKGLAAPGYGSDSDASSSSKGRKARVQAIPPKGPSPGTAKPPLLKANAVAPSKQAKGRKATPATKSSPKDRGKAKAVVPASRKAPLKKPPVPKGGNGRQRNVSNAKPGTPTKRRS